MHIVDCRSANLFGRFGLTAYAAGGLRLTLYGDDGLDIILDVDDGGRVLLWVALKKDELGADAVVAQGADWQSLNAFLRSRIS